MQILYLNHVDCRYLSKCYRFNVDHENVYFNPTQGQVESAMLLQRRYAYVVEFRDVWSNVNGIVRSRDCKQKLKREANINKHVYLILLY